MKRRHNSTERQFDMKVKSINKEEDSLYQEFFDEEMHPPDFKLEISTVDAKNNYESVSLYFGYYPKHNRNPYPLRIAKRWNTTAKKIEFSHIQNLNNMGDLTILYLCTQMGTELFVPHFEDNGTPMFLKYFDENGVSY